MLEHILSYLHTLSPLWIYIILFGFSFIENIFPPSPSDVVVIIGAALIASTSVGYFPILIITSIGSALGFILMYYVGKMFGEKIIRTGRIKFIDPVSLHKVDVWFEKHGYKLIIANRFLPGTRSVISFFSGMYELHAFKTFLCAAISAFLWNAAIIFMGMKLGENLNMIDYYLTTYSDIVIILTVLTILFFVVRYFYKKRKK